MPPGKPAPERWTTHAGGAATATLVIPADALRERRFEIACAITVAVPESGAPGAKEPWHQMTVTANGARQWQRRLASQNPGDWDGLDYRFSRSVPVGESLRVTVAVACAGVRRRTLAIEADEV